jgi:hypothetical protein
MDTGNQECLSWMKCDLKRPALYVSSEICWPQFLWAGQTRFWNFRVFFLFILCIYILRIFSAKSQLYWRWGSDGREWRRHVEKLWAERQIVGGGVGVEGERFIVVFSYTILCKFYLLIVFSRFYWNVGIQTSWGIMYCTYNFAINSSRSVKVVGFSLVQS